MQTENSIYEPETGVAGRVTNVTTLVSTFTPILIAIVAMIGVASGVIDPVTGITAALTALGGGTVNSALTYQTAKKTKSDVRRTEVRYQPIEIEVEKPVATVEAAEDTMPEPEETDESRSGAAIVV